MDGYIPGAAGKPATHPEVKRMHENAEYQTGIVLPTGIDLFRPIPQFFPTAIRD